MVWSATHKQFLRESYNTLGRSRCADALWRSPEATYQKAKAMGLTRQRFKVVTEWVEKLEKIVDDGISLTAQYGDHNVTSMERKENGTRLFAYAVRRLNYYQL